MWAQWPQVQHKHHKTIKEKLMKWQPLCLKEYFPLIFFLSLQVWSAFPLHVRCLWSRLKGSGKADSRGAELRQLPAGRGLLHAGWANLWDHCRVQSPADAGGWRCGLVQLPHAHLKGQWCGKVSPQSIYNKMHSEQLRAIHMRGETVHKIHGLVCIRVLGSHVFGSVQYMLLFFCIFF